MFFFLLEVKVSNLKIKSQPGFKHPHTFIPVGWFFSPPCQKSVMWMCLGYWVNTKQPLYISLCMFAKQRLDAERGKYVLMMSEQVLTGNNNVWCLLSDLMPLTSSFNLAHFILSLLFPCHLTTLNHICLSAPLDWSTLSVIKSSRADTVGSVSVWPNIIRTHLMMIYVSIHF